MRRAAGLLALAGLAGPAPAQAIEVPAGRVTVRPGDTLSAIAQATGASAAEIVRVNRLDPPDRVRLGQRLTIPAGRYHRVRRGETGIAIGRRYGADWGAIATLNRLGEPFVLYEGQRLLLPPADGLTLEARAAAFRIDIDDLVTGSEPARPARVGERPDPPSAAGPRRFDWPVAGRITGGFGRASGGQRRDGIDIAADAGAAIRAVAAGTVAYAGPLAGFGSLVLVRHDGGWHSIYARADALAVRRGEAVTRGQRLARAGDGPVHFELRRGRTPVDPLIWLPRRG